MTTEKTDEELALDALIEKTMLHILQHGSAEDVEAMRRAAVHALGDPDKAAAVIERMRGQAVDN